MRHPFYSSFPSRHKAYIGEAGSSPRSDLNPDILAAQGPVNYEELFRTAPPFRQWLSPTMTIQRNYNCESRNSTKSRPQLRTMYLLSEQFHWYSFAARCFEFPRFRIGSLQARWNNTSVFGNGFWLNVEQNSGRSVMEIWWNLSEFADGEYNFILSNAMNGNYLSGGLVKFKFQILRDAQSTTPLYLFQIW